MKSIFCGILSLTLLSGVSHAMTTSLPARLVQTSTTTVENTPFKSCSGTLVYPLLAQRREAEGITTLSLEINDQGRMSNVDVFKSSGHVDLDQAAINYIETCTFNRPADLKTGEMFYTQIQFVWKLDPPNPVEIPKAAPSQK